MRHQTLSVLALVAVLLQAFLGGVGSVALCLGSGALGHGGTVLDQAGLDQAGVDAAACSCCHASEAPAPGRVAVPGFVPALVPADDPDHDDNCPCTDIELELTDLLASAREVRACADCSLPAPIAVASVSRRAVVPVLDSGWCPIRDADPGGADPPLVVRSVRLLL